MSQKTPNWNKEKKKKVFSRATSHNSKLTVLVEGKESSRPVKRGEKVLEVRILLADCSDCCGLVKTSTGVKGTERDPQEKKGRNGGRDKRRAFVVRQKGGGWGLVPQ